MPDLNITIVLPSGGARAAPVRDRDADDEEEEGEDQVRRRTAVPRSVKERRIDVPPVAGIVHDDHAGHRKSAKRIERHQPRRLLHA